MSLGAGWGAEGGDEGTVDVVDQVDGGEEERGGCERGNVWWGCGEGRVDECVKECNGCDELHEDPGLDAVEEEDAVGGGGEAAKGCIDDELDGRKQRRYHKQSTSGDCQLEGLAGTRQNRNTHCRRANACQWTKNEC